MEGQGIQVYFRIAQALTVFTQMNTYLQPAHPSTSLRAIEPAKSDLQSGFTGPESDTTFLCYFVMPPLRGSLKNQAYT